MKIAICDDEKNFARKIASCLQRQPDCVPYCFLSPSALINSYEAGERYDVLFLDILMEPVNGIALARKIREYDKYAVLVFLTAYLEYAPSGYEVNAFRYLLKPVTDQKIEQVMEDIRREMPENLRILVRTPECNLFLQTRAIQYLEIRDKETVLYCDKDTITVRRGLKDLERDLPGTVFFRVHRKYIVNLAHVREYDSSHLTLDCEKTLPVSRRKSRDFLLAVRRYLTET